MKIRGVRHIDGPNVYIYKPILVARIDLEAYTERESYEFTGFPERLLRTLPGLAEHHCAAGAPGGFVERLVGGTYFGHIVEHVAIEMACLANLDVHYGKTVYAGAAGQYDIIIECKAYALQKALLHAAEQIVQTLVEGVEPDVARIVQDILAAHRHTLLGPSTQAVVEAARARGIPVRRLSDGSLVQLGYGRQRKLLSATITANTSAVSVDIACDKGLTKQLLQDAGIAVPAGGIAASLEEALAWFADIGSPVALKPWNGNQGRGVSLDLRTAAEVTKAYELARTHSDKVIVETFVAGRNLRLLVIDGELAAASERLPAQVVGDGAQTIGQLIDTLNRQPERGIGHEKPLTQITLDHYVVTALARQHLTLDDVPDAGVHVAVRETANLSTGGEAVDITEKLHPSYLQLAKRAARIVGLDVCGIDLVVTDPQAPFDPAHCAVIEVNAAPGIRMHEHPSHGQPRHVGEQIVNMLFPNGSTGRIPLIAVTGTNGKTTTTRLLGHAFACAGHAVGMTTSSGISVAGQLIVPGDTTGPASARVILSDPVVDIAVLETARGGILHGGLGYDKANVAVLTNLTLDHVGQDGIETLEDLLHVKSLVAECVFEDGTVVLNADDDQLLQLGKRLKARVVYFALHPDNPALLRHLACGGSGYTVSHGWIVEVRGHLTWDIVQVQGLPLTIQGTATFHVANALAAVGGMRALGLTRQQVAQALQSFDPAVHNQGRCMMYELPGDIRVVLDYGHNADGFHQMGQWLKTWQHRRLIGVVGVPGDRSEAVVLSACQQLATHFDAFIVKEDLNKRGRRETEVATLLAAHLRTFAPAKPLAIEVTEPRALQQAIALAEPGDIIAVFYEQLTPLQEVIAAAGGVQTVTLGRAERPTAIALP